MEQPRSVDKWVVVRNPPIIVEPEILSLRVGELLHLLLLVLGLMALNRINTIEQLRRCPPGEWGEWGKILRLDRCPGVETLRRKIKLITASGDAVEDWSAQLARDWMEAESLEHSTGGLLYLVDGHVRVYHGSQTKAAQAPRRPPAAVSARHY